MENIIGLAGGATAPSPSASAAGNGSTDGLAPRKGAVMWREMAEQPEALRATLAAAQEALAAGAEAVGDVLRPEAAAQWERIVVVGMGTARHAGLIGKVALQHLARIPVDVCLSSEFRDAELLYSPRTAVVAVSQSGSTGDTLAAVARAKEEGLPVLAITNVEGSTLSQEADGVLYTAAGPEIAIPSTKAYLAQLVAFYMLGLYLGKARGVLSGDSAAAWEEQLARLPEAVAEVLARHGEVEAVAPTVASQNNAFFIGRSLDFPTAQEGALKLKEVSYVHAEACEAGEFRHGPLALVEPGVPVICVATQHGAAARMAGNLEKAAAQQAAVWLVASRNFAAERPFPRFDLPDVPALLAPVVSVVPLQLLAYYTATARGCDPDQPRNLTKSVPGE